MNDYKQETKALIHDLSFFGDGAEQILCRPALHYEIVEYQVEIMGSRSDRFLPLDWIQEGSRDYLIYDKHGFISLEQYFLSHTGDRADFFHCLREMLLSLQLCQDILLDARQIVLEERFIYLKRVAAGNDQVTGFDPYFVYVPVEAKTVEPIPEPEASLLTSIVEYFIEEGKKKNLFLDDEIQLLRQHVMGDISRMITWLEEKIRYPEKPKRRKQASAPTGSKVKKPKENQPLPIEKEESSSSPSDRSSLIKGIILLDIILLFILNISLGLAIKTQAFHFYALTAIGLFILIASDVYILQSNKKEDVSDTRFERERRQKLLSAYELEEELHQTDAAFQEASKKETAADHFSIAYLYPVTSENVSHPDIKSMTKNLKAAAVILNREFYIGNDTDRCDFRPQTTDLSPLHARITKQDNSYLLTDLASESGTYLNNLRLHYYEDYVLFSGAYIRFNDLTYLFVCQEAGDLKLSA